MQRRSGRAVATLLLVSLALAVVTLPWVVASVSIEFSVASVRVSPQLYGAALVLPIPFNASWFPAESNVYVLAESSPVYYHVFSVLPPLAMVFEPSIAPGRMYRVFVSTSNPYAQFRVPYSHDVFAAYDDFDVDAGIWVKTGGVRIGGGSAALSPGAFMALNASMDQHLGAFISVRGGRGLRIELPSAGEHLLVFTSANFTDWQSLRDGTDVYFVSDRLEPQYYSVVHLDKEQMILVTYVVATSQTVFMVYGGENPYASYRVGG